MHTHSTHGAAGINMHLIASLALSLFAVLTPVTLNLQPATALAAACTNSYGSGASAPVGYAVAWNPLTAARELLVQGADCTTSTATMKVGSGAATQLVYNKGYYYTGTAWKEYSLTGTTPLQSNAWYTGTAQASIQLPQTVTYVVGYVCQQQGSAWKCGCRDSTCATSYWQLQAVKGAAAEPPSTGGGGTGAGGYVAGGPQCAGATPPPQASAVGLTKLAFCEDFSDASRIDFDNAPQQGKTTFVAMRPGNIFNASAESKSYFTFTSDGTLESRSAATNYQADFISTWPKGGGSYGGYAVSKNTTGWYVESRLKHNTWSGSKGFYAFWSMATCKIYASGPGCVEPDFYEYIGGKMIHAIHWYPTGGKNDGKKSAMCSAAPNSDRTQFFTTGALYGPGNAYVRWYDNEKMTCEKTSGSYPYLSYMANQDFPIIFGTGPSQPYTIDWIRVWTKP